MEISALGLLLGLLLLALPLYIIFAFDLRLLRRFVFSLVRMVIIVAMLAGIVTILLRVDNLWVNIVVGLAFALLSSVVVVVKSGLRPRRLLMPVMAASIVPLFVLSLYVLLLVLPVKTPFDTRLFIPLLGLMVGLASALITQALRAYYMGLEHHNELYYYLLGNGATHREAVRHFMRRGFLAAFLPAMKRMSGLFVSGAPVLMLGLVMSGIGVWTAAILELVLALAVLGYALSTFWLAILLSRRYAFDDYEHLRPMKRHEESTSSTKQFSEPSAPQSPDTQETQTTQVPLINQAPTDEQS